VCRVPPLNGTYPWIGMRTPSMGTNFYLEDSTIPQYAIWNNNAKPGYFSPMFYMGVAMANPNPPYGFVGGNATKNRQPYICEFWPGAYIMLQSSLVRSRQPNTFLLQCEQTLGLPVHRIMLVAEDMCDGAPVLPYTNVTKITVNNITNMVMYQCTNGKPIQNGFYTKIVHCACQPSDWNWILAGINGTCAGGQCVLLLSTMK
jgi:hypothetical protein